MTESLAIDNTIMDFLSTAHMKNIFTTELFKVRPQDKEDVKQEAIIRILKSLRKQEVPEDVLVPHCRIIIRRTAIDYYRYRARKIEKISFTMFFTDAFVKAEDSKSYGPSAGAWHDTSISLNLTHLDENYEIVELKRDFDINRHMFTGTEQKVIDYLLDDSENISKSMADIARDLQINKSFTTRAFQKLRKIANS